VSAQIGDLRRRLDRRTRVLRGRGVLAEHVVDLGRGREEERLAAEIGLALRELLELRRVIALSAFVVFGFLRTEAKRRGGRERRAGARLVERGEGRECLEELLRARGARDRGERAEIRERE